MDGMLIGFKGKNCSGRINQNLLYKYGKVYIMDNHRAALWCWLQHCNKNKKYNLIHIDKHTDTLQSRLEEWLAVFTNVEDMTIDEYLNRSYRMADGNNYPIFQYDNYLSIFFKQYDYLINDVFMFTHGEGDNPNFNCALYEQDVLDFSYYREIFTPIFNSKLDCILNIDLDYFYDDGYEENESFLCIKKGYIKDFFSLVKEYADSGKIAVITISLSPEFTNGWDEVLELLNIINEELDIPFTDI